MQHQLQNRTTIWGVLLIALGAFFLLQVTGIFGALSALFWSAAFAVGGAVFLYFFLTQPHNAWWAAIPGFTLMGLGATVFYERFAPPFLSDLGGAVFLASIGVGFWAIFFTNREYWWAIIPGGALFSVAGVVVASESGFGINPASVLFVGLGLTFALLALMSTYLNTNLRWAYIPAAVMLIMGVVIFTPFVGALGWVWPLGLIAGGAYLILRRPPAADNSSGERTGDAVGGIGFPAQSRTSVPDIELPGGAPAAPTDTPAVMGSPVSTQVGVQEPAEPFALR
jgi:hypothetical protein